MLADLSPLEPGIFWLLTLASFAGSFITAAFGIGGGGALLALMAVLMPTSALIPVHGLVQLGSNAGRLGLMFRHVLWTATPGFAVGSVVGCALGGIVVIDLPTAAVQTGVGLFVLWTVFARPPSWLRDAPVLTGGISSFLTMFFGATGLFVASYTKSLALPRHDHVATHAALMTLQHGLKVVVFGLLGFAFGPWAVLIVVMIVAGLAGTVVGRMVLSRIGDRNFRLALDTFLVLISLRLIYAGVSDVFR